MLILKFFYSFHDKINISLLILHGGGSWEGGTISIIIISLSLSLLFSSWWFPGKKKDSKNLSWTIFQVFFWLKFRLSIVHRYLDDGHVYIVMVTWWWTLKRHLIKKPVETSFWLMVYKSPGLQGISKQGKCFMIQNSVISIKDVEGNWEPEK